MSNHPRIVPYRNLEEVQNLYGWFFGPEADQRKAISMVKVYTTRGLVPYSMQCTALFASALVSDKENSLDSFSVQLMYASAIIRFVNGILDKHQTSQYAIPLHSLALSVGLPTYFVELRHACTHEELPPLSVLRSASENAMDWLKIRYWEVKLEEATIQFAALRDLILEQLDIWWSTSSKRVSQIIEDFEDPETEVTTGTFSKPWLIVLENTQEAKTCRNILKLLIQQFQRSKTDYADAASLAIFQFGVNTSGKSLISIRTFGPILQKLGVSIVDAMLSLCLDVFVKETASNAGLYDLPVTNELQQDIIKIVNTTENHSEFNHAVNWSRHILTNPKLYSFSADSFVTQCLQRSKPLPIISSIIQLAMKSCADKAKSLQRVNLYKTQVDLLYGSKESLIQKQTSTIKRIITLDAQGSETPQQQEATIQDEIDRRNKLLLKRRKTILSTEISENSALDERIRHGPRWYKVDDTWTPRPIGIL
ncbi:Las1-like-domain-containing protein [Dipodascopsis uninucleata]